MFTSLGLIALVCFIVGTAVVITIAMRSGRNAHSGGSIAQVLYNVEHPEKTR